MQLSDLKILGEQEIKKLLQEEGRKLEKIAKQVWQRYLSSYRPKYIRTGKSLASIKLGQIERFSATEFGIRVNFKDELAYHDSVFIKGQQGHAIILISYGWRVRKGRHRNIYRFGYYEGFNYIEKVMAEYSKVKPPEVQIHFDWNGRYLR